MAGVRYLVPSSLSDSVFRLPNGMSPERPGGERQPLVAVHAVPDVATAIVPGS